MLSLCKKTQAYEASKNSNLELHTLNARFECNDIVISVYSHYPFDQNAKSSDTKCFTLSIKCFCILIKRLMTLRENFNVIAFKSCIQKLTVYRVLIDHYFTFY